MTTKGEKLKEILDKKNGEVTLQLVAKTFEEYQEKIDTAISDLDTLKSIKPEPGYTPQKGVDYFTEKEIKEIIDFVQSKVTNGKDGKDGKDGVGKDGKNGRDGKDAVVDYPKIIKEVLSKIPKPTKEKPIDIDDIILKVKDSIPEINYKEEIGKILATPGFRMLLHGGGLTTISHDSTLTGDGTPSNPLHAVGDGIGDMLKATYDPDNGARQVAFKDQLTDFSLGINSYMEYTLDGSGNITNVDWWTDSGKGTKLFTKVITWTVQNQLSL